MPEPDMGTLDYKIHVTGTLWSRYMRVAGCCILVDDGHKNVTDARGLIVDPPRRYGCRAIGPLAHIAEDGRFSFFYWIQLLGADPRTVPIPAAVTLHLETGPGTWHAQRVPVRPSMVTAQTDREMRLDLDRIEWRVPAALN